MYMHVLYINVYTELQRLYINAEAKDCIQAETIH